MSIADAESRIEYLESHLDRMEDARGMHSLYVHATHDFIYNAQSAYESLEENIGGHSGTKPDDDLLDWTFEFVNEDRHNERNSLEHADVVVGRTPGRFGNTDPEVLLEEQDGDHEYYFKYGDDSNEIPSEYANDSVREVCEEILQKLRRKLRRAKSESSSADDFSLISNDPATDK